MDCDLDSLSLIELKALAYDTLAKLQEEQLRLNHVNSAIVKKNTGIKDDASNHQPRASSVKEE